MAMNNNNNISNPTMDNKNNSISNDSDSDNNNNNGDDNATEYLVPGVFCSRSLSEGFAQVLLMTLLYILNQSAVVPYFSKISCPRRYMTYIYSIARLKAS